MKAKFINQELAAIIDRQIRQNQTAHLSWIVQEFIKRHNNISGQDKDLYTFALSGLVKDRAKRIIRKFDSDIEEIQASLLPGHEYLKVAYSIERHGEQVLVPIEQCTNDELLARADEFDRNAKGLKDHARELRMFVGTRNVADELSA